MKSSEARPHESVQRHLPREQGQAVIFITLSLTVLFGMLSLLVDIGWAYWRQGACKAAAQSAAIAAALAANKTGIIACGPGVTCQSATACPVEPAVSATDNLMSGCLYAKQNGFVASGRQNVMMAAGTTGVPVSGVAPDYWVTATVSETNPTLFGAVLGRRHATVSVTSLAGIYEKPVGGCAYVLNPTASRALRENGTGTTLQTGCGVYVNSNDSSAVWLNGGNTIVVSNGGKLNVVGGVSTVGTSSITPDPVLGAPAVTDPFAAMDPPSVGPCDSTGVTINGGQSQTLSPGVYCGAINLAGNSAATLQPGLYILKGGLSMSGGTTLTGTGVTLYIASGSVTFAGGAIVTLSPPVSGAWQGILMFQDRNNTSAASLVGGSTQTLSGVLYFPKAALSYSGGSSATPTNTTIVADTLLLSGGSFIKNASINRYTGVTTLASLMQ